MQISTANLLASQALRSPSKAEASKAAPEDGFAPLLFKQSEAPLAKTAAADAAPVSSPSAAATSAGNGYIRPGTNLDIKI